MLGFLYFPMNSMGLVKGSWLHWIKGAHCTQHIPLIFDAMLHSTTLCIHKMSQQNSNCSIWSDARSCHTWKVFAVSDMVWNGLIRIPRRSWGTPPGRRGRGSQCWRCWTRPLGSRCPRSCPFFSPDQDGCNRDFVKKRVNFALKPTWIFCMLSLLNSLLSLFASWSQKSPELLFILYFHKGCFCSFTLYNEAELGTGYPNVHIYIYRFHNSCWNCSSIVLIHKASPLPCDLNSVSLES